MKQLIQKFPDFNPQWKDDVQIAWFQAFRELSSLFGNTIGIKTVDFTKEGQDADVIVGGDAQTCKIQTHAAIVHDYSGHRKRLRPMRVLTEKLMSEGKKPREILQVLEKRFPGEHPVYQTVVNWGVRFRRRNESPVKNLVTKFAEPNGLKWRECIELDHLPHTSLNCKRDGVGGVTDPFVCLSWQFRWRFQEVGFAQLNACRLCRYYCASDELLKNLAAKFGKENHIESD
jgi:hypothetical protein